jgi:hypothetical protein
MDGAIDPRPAGIEVNGYLPNFLPAAEINSHLFLQIPVSSNHRAKPQRNADLCASLTLDYAGKKARGGRNPLVIPHPDRMSTACSKVQSSISSQSFCKRLAETG